MVGYQPHRTPGVVTRRTPASPITAAIADAGAELPCDRLHGTKPAVDGARSHEVKFAFVPAAKPESINEVSKWHYLRRNTYAQLWKAAAVEAAHPDRFTRRPKPPELPEAAWINQPSQEALIQTS